MLKFSLFQKGIASAIAIFICSFALSALTLQPLNRPGWIIYDWLQKITAIEKTDEVALILVDQHTLDQMEKAESITFPFPRQLYGLINTVAAKAQARAVVYDLLFTESSSYGPEDDAHFAKLIQDSKVPTFMPAASEKGFVKEPVAALKPFVAGLGGVHFQVETDGVVRRAPPHLKGTSGPVLSLPEAAYRVIGKAVEEVEKDQYEFVPSEKLLRFYQPQGIPFISFYNLVLAYRALENGNDLPEELNILKGRALVVGYSAPGLHDLKPIPTDKEAPGVLVPATALANRLDKIGVSFVSTKSFLFVSASFIVMLLLLGLLIKTPKLSATIVGIALPLVVAIATFVFWKNSYWLNPLPLFLGSFTAGVSQLLLKFFTYWAEGRRFAKSMAYSMSPELVGLIRSGEVKVERYGEQREISILFCDIVGFSKLSENLDPRQLVTILNRYSDAAVELIFNNKGYVDKFIGDAVMAFWGAPVPQTDHASRALGVAIAYTNTIHQFNQRLAVDFPRFPGLNVRIGLHTGTAIVGNIGAKNRHNYTAIGDDVNLAARLEGLAKAYDCHLLISEETIKAANAFDRKGLIELDHVTVRGRSQSTRVFTFAPQLSEESLAQYQIALKFYYAAEWSKALQSFERVQGFSTAVIMAERCRKSLKDGSLKEWNQGVWCHAI